MQNGLGGWRALGFWVVVVTPKLIELAHKMNGLHPGFDRALVLSTHGMPSQETL